MRKVGDEKICIYVVSHKNFHVPTDNPIYIPLMVGNNYKTLHPGYITDTKGDSISGKNLSYNELTGLYWAWKNSEADIIGICHYRRYFVTIKGKIENLLMGLTKKIDKKWLIDEEYISKMLIQHDIILHNKTFFARSNKDSLLVVLDKEIYEIIPQVIKELYPEYADVFERVMEAKKAHLLNLLICSKEIINDYCGWLFDILFEIEKRIKQQYPEKNMARVMGYIGERLLDVWVEYNDLRIKETFSINTTRVDWKVW